LPRPRSFFKGRWTPVPYIYNALKTLRIIHPDLWRDEDVRNIHYMSVRRPTPLGAASIWPPLN
jgi:hypothetical protein